MTTFAPINALIALTDTGGDTTATTGYTFTGKALGAADANRYIIVAVGARASGASRAISSVTIGGVAASPIAIGGSNLIEALNSTAALTALYYAAVPTGTTGDVAITWNFAVTFCSVALYRAIVGAGGIASITPVATEKVVSTSPSAAPQLNGSIDLPANGTLIVTAAGNNCGGSWISDYGTYRQDGKFGTAAHSHMAARRANVLAMTAHKYGVKFSGSSPASCAMGAAVFA